MYEPSDAIIEQLAREFCENLGPEQEWGDNEFHQAFLAVARERASYPTIRKALELYENQPQWQDKPDKEGWYGVRVKGGKCGWVWLYSPASAVYVSKQKGTIHIEAEGYDHTLSEFLRAYTYSGIKFIYLCHKLNEPYKDGE